MITVEQIRQSMMIKHTKLDNDIKRYIDACPLDMQRAGVNIQIESALMDTAIEHIVNGCLITWDKATDMKRHIKR